MGVTPLPNCQFSTTSRLLSVYFPNGDIDRALQIYKELGDQVGLGEALFYRGLVYQMQEQNLHAREMFDQALALTNKTGDERLRSFVVRHIGYMQQTAGENLAEAMRLVEKAIPLAKSGNSPRALYSAQLTLAKWYAHEGKTTKAKDLAEQSRAGAQAFGNPSDMKEAEDFLHKHA
jgi:tetratricopeptide (TPR) repeat protein